MGKYYILKELVNNLEFFSKTEKHHESSSFDEIWKTNSTVSISTDFSWNNAWKILILLNYFLIKDAIIFLTFSLCPLILRLDAIIQKQSSGGVL